MGRETRAPSIYSGRSQNSGRQVVRASRGAASTNKVVTPKSKVVRGAFDIVQHYRPKDAAEYNNWISYIAAVQSTHRTELESAKQIDLFSVTLLSSQKVMDALQNSRDVRAMKPEKKTLMLDKLTRGLRTFLDKQVSIGTQANHDLLFERRSGSVVANTGWDVEELVSVEGTDAEVLRELAAPNRLDDFANDEPFEEISYVGDDYYESYGITNEELDSWQMHDFGHAAYAVSDHFRPMPDVPAVGVSIAGNRGLYQQIGSIVDYIGSHSPLEIDRTTSPSDFEFPLWPLRDNALLSELEMKSPYEYAIPMPPIMTFGRPVLTRNMSH